MRDPLQRLYQTKLALLAVVFVVLGAVLLVIAHWPLGLPVWIQNLPITDLGSAFFTTGLVVVAFEYVDGKDSDVRAEARLRAILRSELPAIREAVIRGFAVETEDLKRVATPELLDQIAESSLGLRFGDQQFAKEVYGDISDQAIKAAERWYDARVQIDLRIRANAGAARVPVFDVVVRWEYRVVPRHRFRRFAVVADRQSYDELSGQAGETSAWFKSPIPGLELSDPAAFALVQFTVDGDDRPISHHADETSQTYVVDVTSKASIRLLFHGSIRTARLNTGNVMSPWMVTSLSPRDLRSLMMIWKSKLRTMQSLSPRSRRFARFNPTTGR
jgi:hypothetical protein